MSEDHHQVSTLLQLRDSLGWSEGWPVKGAGTKLSDYCNHVPGIECDRSQEHLIVIKWDDRNLRGTLPTSIGRLTRLEKLQLGRNSLYGTLPSSLNRLSRLEHLELFRNEFTGTLPDCSGMTSLKRLLIHSNHFTGSLHSANLCHLPALHGLDIFQNPFQGTLPQCMGEMRLQTFQLHNTQLTGTIPAGFCEKLPRCDGIACPVGSYETTRGRYREEKDGSALECLSCPASLYLGSTLCPETLAPSGTPHSVPSITSVEPTETITLTPINENADDSLPSVTFKPTEFNVASLTKSPSVIDPWGPIDITTENKTTPFPTDAPTVYIERPRPPWLDLVAQSPPPEVPRSADSSTSASTDWTLLATACLLSSIAMLMVVLARHFRRRSHALWYQRQTGQFSLGSGQPGAEARSPRRAVQRQSYGFRQCPATFTFQGSKSRNDNDNVNANESEEELDPSLGRLYLLTERQRSNSSSNASESSGSSHASSPCRWQARCIPYFRQQSSSISSSSAATSKLSRDFQGRRYEHGMDEDVEALASLASIRRLLHHRQSHGSSPLVPTQNMDEDEDQFSLESESGWNDTVSSVDDGDDIEGDDLPASNEHTDSPSRPSWLWFIDPWMNHYDGETKSTTN